MDREMLREKMRAKAEALIEQLAEQASASRQDMARMERAIYEGADSLKAQLLQVWLDEACDDTARPSCPHCGGPLRSKQQAPRTCVCVGGQVQVARRRWWCAHCGVSFFPSGREGDGRGLSDHSRGGEAGGGGGGGAEL